jgi:hypothetical protein
MTVTKRNVGKLSVVYWGKYRQVIMGGLIKLSQDNTLANWNIRRSIQARRCSKLTPISLSTPHKKAFRTVRLQI